MGSIEISRLNASVRACLPIFALMVIAACQFACCPGSAWADDAPIVEQAEDGISVPSRSAVQVSDTAVSDGLSASDGAESQPVGNSSEASGHDAIVFGSGFPETPAELNDVVALADDEFSDSVPNDSASQSISVAVTPESLEQAVAMPDEAEQTITATTFEDIGVIMYRLYNPNSGEHFYTGSSYERTSVIEAGWNDEGIGWIAPTAGSEVYRLYNPNAGDHHYTLSAYERDYLVNVGWNYEGVGWHSGGDYAVYREYNPNAYASGKSGAHNYTVSLFEHDSLSKVGWRDEGVGWQALGNTLDNFEAMRANSTASVRAVVPSTDSAEANLTLSSTLVGDTYYMFLPSYANMNAVKLAAQFKGDVVPIYLTNTDSTTFTLVPLGSAADVASTSTVTGDNGAKLLRFTTAETKVVQKLAVMMSAGVGSVYVDSVDPDQGRDYIESSADHTLKANVIVTVLDSEGEVVYNADTDSKSSTIKGRGNNTWGIGDKKPYQVTLGKSCDLLQTGDKANKQKKWILLANANDATLLHNTVAYNTALELGMVGTECLPVDLYYDGEYRGSYLLCEKIQIKEGRIDIVDLEDLYEKANEDVDFSNLPVKQATNSLGRTYRYVDGVQDPEDLTGGYLLELDNAYYKKEVCWFQSTWGVVVVKSPEYCSKKAMLYISEYFETAIQRLNSGQTISDDGMVFDLESLARTYIVNEYFKNIDVFISSTYFYKDVGDTAIFAQPIWDCDGSMGVRSDWTDTSFITYQGFILPHVNDSVTKSTPLAHVEVLQDKAREIWNDELSPLLGSILLSGDLSASGTYLHSLEYYHQQIAASQKMDEVLFGLTAFGNEIEPFATYDLNYQYLANWLQWRKEWMDDNIDRISNGMVNNAPWTYEDIDYGLVFDASYYKKVNEGKQGMTDEEALEDFVHSGMEQGLVASRNFNVEAYKNRYGDLRAAFGDDLSRYYLHYKDIGFKEGRIAL